VVDERSAAFTAMGMAKSLKNQLPFLVLLVLQPIIILPLQKLFIKIFRF
jgi:hypothetical protein